MCVKGAKVLLIPGSVLLLFLSSGMFLFQVFTGLSLAFHPDSRSDTTSQAGLPDRCLMLTAPALVTPILAPALLPEVTEFICSLVSALWPLPAWNFRVQQHVPCRGLGVAQSTAQRCFANK